MVAVLHARLGIGVAGLCQLPEQLDNLPMLGREAGTLGLCSGRARLHCWLAGAPGSGGLPGGGLPRRPLAVHAGLVRLRHILDRRYLSLALLLTLQRALKSPVAFRQVVLGLLWLLDALLPPFEELEHTLFLRSEGGYVGPGGHRRPAIARRAPLLVRRRGALHLTVLAGLGFRRSHKITNTNIKLDSVAIFLKKKVGRGG